MQAGVDTDTIVAVATAPGRGGVGVVRLSGTDALVIAQRICGKAQPLEPRLATLSTFRTPAGERLDQGLCLCFPGPASFTGENVSELQGHGSPVVLDRIVQTAIAAGARLARPGEFSERAYLNGKMDLAQAEAVADLINAASAKSAQAAMRSLQGEFSALLNALSVDLLALRVQVEAAIDFPDEDIELLSAPGVTNALSDLIDAVENIVKRTQTGVRLTEGARLVLIGAPNVGKSSVLNRLCGEDRAIVTAVAGTTRDLVREQLLLNGIPVELVDTAGIRDTADLIEAEGVRRAGLAAQQADLVLAVYDLGEPQTLEFLTQWLKQHWAAETTSKKISTDDLNERSVGSHSDSSDTKQGYPSLVIVANKRDRIDSSAAEFERIGKDADIVYSELALTNLATPGAESGVEGTQGFACVSAKTGEGIHELTERLVELLKVPTHTEDIDTFSARSRHLQALKRSCRSLLEAQQGISNQLDAELVAEHLRHAQAELGSVCGEVTTDELLGEIFSGFCIGK